MGSGSQSIIDGENRDCRGFGDGIGHLVQLVLPDARAVPDAVDDALCFGEPAFPEAVFPFLPGSRFSVLRDVEFFRHPGYNGGGPVIPEKDPG